MSQEMSNLRVFATVLFCLSSLLILPVESDNIPDQDYGYVEVRQNAHMFWWLYGCTDKLAHRDERPIVLWLQGGPGGSSTGFGNFEEIGQLDTDLKPRNTSWVQAASILFVDNPVGTGYSYVDDLKYLTKDVKEITEDLVTLIQAFLKKYSVFRGIPFYIFCESYGGKMAAALGVALMEAWENNSVDMTFEGVALGDGWISPMDSIKTWGPFLYANSLINSAGVDRLQSLVEKAQSALDKGDGKQATAVWGEMEGVVSNLTDDVDFYNILNHNGNSESILSYEHGCNTSSYIKKIHQDKLAALMNGRIKEELNIPKHVIWGAQSGAVFEYQQEDFMKDVIADVDKLLSSNKKVVVYSGQLDLIVDTIGTLEWIKKLKWKSLSNFLAASRTPLYPPSAVKTNDTGAFVQHYDNFYFYWILKAGHMVPRDAGEMALTMFKKVINAIP